MSAATWNWSESAPDGWDDYVLAHPDAHAFHTAAAVRIGAEAFGLRTHYLTVRSRYDRITGVLPLVEQMLIPWTRTLVSLPFCTYGGPLADDEETLRVLVDGAEQVAKERNASRIVLRHVSEMPCIKHPVSLNKVSMVLELPETREQLARQLGSKLRSQIKRAERLVPEVMVGNAELLDDFYTVFRSVMRNLGTPVYPRLFFDVVADALRNTASVLVIRVNGKPVSAAVLVQWRDVIEVPWAGTLHSMNPTAVNMRLYWELLQLAVTRGCRAFDFGRCTRDAGTYRFKAQWGAQPLQLQWHAWQPGSAAEAGGPSSALGGSTIAARLWSKLPESVASWLGPRISARLPW